MCSACFKILLLLYLISKTPEQSPASDLHHTLSYDCLLYTSGTYYYFRGWGGMYRSTFFKLSGETYYADADGKMVTGWLSKENQWYYFRENGAMYRNTFFTHLNNSYYADANGVMVTGERTINGAYY